jgi:hypothetical protein
MIQMTMSYGRVQKVRCIIESKKTRVPNFISIALSTMAKGRAHILD